MINKTTILFVYNGDSDLLSGIKDSFHKILKPSTYECRLCSLTYGPLAMKRDWKSFVKNLGYEVNFLHRDEFRKRYKNNSQLPAAFLENEKELKPFITAKEMNTCNTLQELETLVENRVKSLK